MKRSLRLMSVLTLSVLSPLALAAQSTPSPPSHRFLVTGYGTAGWNLTQERPNGFYATFTPVFLFSINEAFLAEAELEFALADGATETALEYATVHYLANDYLMVSAGKFLVPFGVFSQRLHPSWINRFASTPPMYGHHGAIPGVDPLLPIIGDVGVMASAVAPLGGIGRSVTFSAYLTNGPRPGEVAMGAGMEEGRPEFGFGQWTGDNNDNKMLGGRIGLVLAPQFELDISALHAKWAEGDSTTILGNSLYFSGLNLAAEYRPVPALELRTEWMWLRTDVEDMTGTSPMVVTIPQVGGYAQAAYRSGPWEPVARFALVNANEDEQNESLTQYGIGLDYWFSPSMAIMAAFELNKDHYDDGSDLPNNRVLIHWAFGF